MWLIKQTVDLVNMPMYSGVAAYALMFPGDSGAHEWSIEVLNNGAAVDLTGYTAAAYFLRKDGNTVLIEGTISGNTISIVLAQACYAYSGAMQAGVRLTKDSAVTTVAYKLFNVLPPYTSSGTIDPGEVIPTIDDLLEQIEAMEEATAAAEAAATKAVRYDSAQSLTDAQKLQARTNIGLNFTDAGNGVIVVG